LVLLAIILIVADKNIGLRSVHAALSTLAAPFYWLSSVPERVNRWGDDNLVSRDRLMEQNEALRARVLMLESGLLEFRALADENERLRALLNASNRVTQTPVAAQMIGVVPDPVRQILVLDKGRDDGVEEGMAVLDRFGVAGQVILATASTSHVLLVTDNSHAVPVRFTRTGVRSVAQGRGEISSIELLFVPATSDVSIGDEIVTSGLGAVFPEGYPVGEVETIIRDPNQPFMSIKLRPFARLNRSRFFMVLIPDANPVHEPDTELRGDS
jgi:rod shape-determining protein MreC